MSLRTDANSNQLISDLLEPYASASLLQFCSRTFIRPHSHLPL